MADTVRVKGRKKEPKSYDIDVSMVVTSFDEGRYEPVSYTHLYSLEDAMLDNIREVITKPNVIAGLILVVAALVTALLSKRIAARFLRNGDPDRIFQLSLRIKTVALIVAFAGAIFVVVL